MPISARPTHCRRISSLAAGLIAVAGLIGCGGDIANPGGGGSGLRIVSGASASDTISSYVAQPLVVQVLDSSGRVVAGRPVRFEVVPDAPNRYAEALSIAREGTQLFTIIVVDTTDSRGRAAVRVRLGIVAGAEALSITVPDLGYADTARYTVLPGALDHVAIGPTDTAAYVGKGYVVRARGADRGNNTRVSDPITFSVTAGPATIDAKSGALVATAIGRASIVASSGAKSATAQLSVVPQAVVATQQHDPGNGGTLGIFLMELDGSNRTFLAAGLDNAFVSGQGFGWSPDGRDLAIARGDAIDLVSPGSAERQLVKTNGPVFLGARFSRDGQWIYYAHSQDGLSRVRRDGSAVERIGNAVAEYGQWGEDFLPSPSADGRSLVYGSFRTPCGVADCIRVLDIATGAGRSYGGRTFLVNGTIAAWSPTDDLIAYAAGGLVGVIRSDGTGQRVLAADIKSEVKWMDWSPDGKWLLVSPPMGPAILFDVQTGTQLPIPTLAGYGATAWRP